MARKRNSIVGDIFELLVQMPWWIGIIVAIGFWITGIVLYGKNDGDEIRSALAPLMRAFFNILGCMSVVAAAISAIKSSSRRKLLDQARALEDIRALSWQQFEHLVGEVYRRQGYEVQETGGGGADGGVDLFVYGTEKKVLVQCKQWRSRKVGVDKVREMYGILASDKELPGLLGASGHCVIVTSGYFTEEARAFAAGKSIELIDGPKLLKLIESIQGGKLPPNVKPGSAKSSLTFKCPLCASPMVLRTAKKGQYAGSQFYGCSKYPECKGIRPA